MNRFATTRPQISYTQAIKNIFTTSLIGYWPLSDLAGTVAYDHSGNGRHGVYTAVTLGQTGIGDGLTSGSFNGTSSKVNLSSASLIAAYNGAEITQIIWVKASAAADWTDGTARAIMLMSDSGFSRMNAINRNAADNTLVPTSMGRNQVVMGGSTDWFQIALTRSESNNRIRTYVNGGLQTPNTPTTVGNLWGALTLSQAWVGDNSLGNFYKGNLAHVVLLNREATATEIYNSYIAGVPPTKRFGILGDSIAIFEYSWGWRVPAKYGGGGNYLINHGVTGNNIISNMDAQTTAAASDNADFIIIALGTNDDNAGNMATLQAEAEENIVELKASNPRATLYWLNVLPRWTNTGGGTVVDKSNIRTAIAAACTAQSITCWDPFSTPWITAAQTSDGTHPNAAGFLAITTEILARL